MKAVVALLLLGAVAGTTFTHRRADEFRGELSMLELQGATGATGATGPSEKLPSEGILNELLKAPLATGATAAEQGPKPSDSLPAPSSTGPAARGALVGGQIGVTGYSEKEFVGDAQVPFRRAIAAVLGIDEGLVKVTGIDADVAGGVSLAKVTKGKGTNAVVPENIAFPDAPAKEGGAKPVSAFLEQRSLRGDTVAAAAQAGAVATGAGSAVAAGVPAAPLGGKGTVAAAAEAAGASIAAVSAVAGGAACRVDFTAAVDMGKGRGAAKKIETAVAGGSFLAKFVEFGASKAKAVRVSEPIVATGGSGVSAKDEDAAKKDPEAAEKKWRTGAGHWQWVQNAHLREKAAEAAAAKEAPAAAGSESEAGSSAPTAVKA